MTDPTTQFFEELGQRGHVPSLESTTGTVRCDVLSGKKTEHWFIALDKGHITVSHDERPADCTITGEKSLFDAFSTGDANPVSAMLRGTITVEGNMRLLVLIRRLLPASSQKRQRSAVAAGWSRQ
jgi:putative sterol carrier protein